MKIYQNINSVISPKGNGIDCHRTWECLYLGVIPIVEKSTHMSYFNDLPILFVDNYNDISIEYLNQIYIEFQHKSFNLDKLSLSYWKHKIKGHFNDKSNDYTNIPKDWKKLGGYSHANNKKEFFDLLLISEHFNFKRNGFFIEIGANNGVMQSNTYMLEKHYDWKGLLVEPSISGYNNCKKVRNNSIVINSCVGNENDKKKEFIYGDFNGHCMSSIDGNRRNNKTELVKCPITTLESILDEHCINDIDFFSLDVEGYEYQVLEGLNLKKYKPKFILIEVHPDEKQKIDTLLTNNDYIFVSNFSNYNKKDNPGWCGKHQDLLYKLTNIVTI